MKLSGVLLPNDGMGARMTLTDELGRSLLDVIVTRSPQDEVVVVEIDTHEALGECDGEPRCRIWLNEACLHEKPPFPVGAEDPDG